MAIEDKAGAHRFLSALEKLLRSSLPTSVEMKSWISETVPAAKRDAAKGHLRTAESALLNGQVVPLLFGMLQREAGLDSTQARHALLNEFFKGTREMSSGSPVRRGGHPFTKTREPSLATYERWAKSVRGGGLHQSCPDLALQAPFPWPTVFEGKYFAGESVGESRRVLVDSIYEAFFYRALPELPATKTHAQWKYDYACLLAYDASEGGTLKSAWEDLRPKVRDSFWDNGNVYVMVLGGDGADG